MAGVLVQNERVTVAEKASGDERSILIVDDDLALRSTLAEQLVVDGEFWVAEAASVAEADEAISKPGARFDAIIMDVSLPDGDGRDFCTQLRARGFKIPIIMLTGSAEETDIVRGLDFGRQ